MNVVRKEKTDWTDQPHTLPQPSLVVEHLSLKLSTRTILHDLSFTLPATGITTVIGPSGAGKSSLLRCLNRLHEAWSGKIDLWQQDRYRDSRQWLGGVDALRQHVGLITQKPALFPVSIYQNVLFGLSRRQRKEDQQARVQHCLTQAALWDEVKDRLHAPANTLSIGQQQRLCLARALALKPKLLLLDEPTASLDPRSKQFIESSLHTLAKEMPLLCVTHDLDQAQRLQGQVIFICDGKIIESGSAARLFKQPARLETREFLSWSVCDCD